MELLNINSEFELTPYQESSLIMAIEEKQIPEIIFRLSQAHLAILSIGPYQTNLEEIYISVTGGGSTIE